MRKEGIEALVAFGTNWQEAYLRYVTDFCILEGSGIAILTSDGQCRLYLESVAEAERAGAETSVSVKLVRNLAEAVGDGLASISNQHIAAAPPQLMPSWLTAKERRFRLDDGTGLVDRLMMEKMPSEIDAMRRAAVLADEGYAQFREAARVGRPQYEIVAEVEEYFRKKGSPDNFMII